MKTPRESEIAQLLTDLLAVQDELLDILSRKCGLLKAGDTDGLAALGPREEELVGRLHNCVKSRKDLLQRAGQDGLPSASIRALAGALPRDQRDGLNEQIQLARSRTRLLQHHSLTNWVVIQRTLLHLSQMIEIIATGGRLQPTYGEGEPVNASGGLVDRAA